MRAYEITDGKDKNVIQGLKQLKDKKEQHKQSEIQLSKKMLPFKSKPDSNMFGDAQNGEEQGKIKIEQFQLPHSSEQ